MDDYKEQVNNITYKINNFLQENQYYFKDVNLAMEEVEEILEETWTDRDLEISELVEQGIKNEYEELYKNEYSELLEKIDIESMLYQIYGDAAAEMIENGDFDLTMDISNIDAIGELQKIEEKYEESLTMQYLRNTYGTDADKIARKMGDAAASDSYSSEQIDDCFKQVQEERKEIQSAINKCVAFAAVLGGVENFKDKQKNIEMDNEKELF